MKTSRLGINGLTLMFVSLLMINGCGGDDNPVTQEGTAKVFSKYVTNKYKQTINNPKEVKI